ncbi:TetR family transcriptional regulator [Streptomyces sp. NPDC020742]|uniref:TetR/AcrR family transcriptional regulator n=1 Tax=Streptomyces sp. NPDC020742 TaxID=3154897 RepID=UPI0033C9D6E3
MLRMVSARTTASTPPGTPKIGLRERKKIQTRQAIQRAAFRLFQDQGYDATPVDRIAEAADVSTSTVFRYFPTKEDIVLSGEYATVLEAGLRARPAREPMVESVRQVTVEVLRALGAADRKELVQRIRLIRDVPAIRGRTAENTARDAALITAVLAERSGRQADDLTLRVISSAVLAALQEAMLRWVEENDPAGPAGPAGPDGPTDLGGPADVGGPADLERLIELLNQTMDVLARGLTL